MLAVRGFDIQVKTSRNVYLDRRDLRGRRPDLRRPRRADRREAFGDARQTRQPTRAESSSAKLESKEVETGKDGKAKRQPQGRRPQGGNHLIRVSGTDRFGNPIVADRALYISGKQDETKLRILAERQNYKAGEEASVNVHSRGRAGTALLTWEADRILSYQIVPLADGDNPVAWTVDGAQFPNFTLTPRGCGRTSSTRRGSTWRSSATSA